MKGTRCQSLPGHTSKKVSREWLFLGQAHHEKIVWGDLFPCYLFFMLFHVIFPKEATLQKEGMLSRVPKPSTKQSEKLFHVESKP